MAVREIRNKLEGKGHNPLMFFLKCMEDDNKILPELIKNEISARNWFILCESENSMKSKWVQDEVSIIKNHSDKVYEIIDLEKDLSHQMQKIESISKRTTLFISYARQDFAFARRIYNDLLKEDFKIFIDFASLSPGELWAEQIDKAITEAVREGFVIMIVSKAFLVSPNIREDLLKVSEAMATHKNNIIVIFIEKISKYLVPYQLQLINGIEISERDFDSKMKELVQGLKKSAMD